MQISITYENNIPVQLLNLCRNNCFSYLVLNIADSVTENIIHHFPTVKRFIDECHLNGGKVLVHGNGGISRSAALAIGYIMEKYELSIK